MCKEQSYSYEYMSEYWIKIYLHVAHFISLFFEFFLAGSQPFTIDGL